MKKNLFSLNGLLAIIGLFVVAVLVLSFLAGCSAATGASQQPASTTSAATSRTSFAERPEITPGPVGSTTAPPATIAYPVKSTVLNIPADGDTVKIPVSMINQYTNTRFKVTTPQGPEMCMAYNWAGKTYVRASICPPCRSQSFTLTSKGTLTCDACGTVFDAVTGKGLSGSPACVTYPKQSAAFQSDGENITVSRVDLLDAYQRTLNQK